MLAILPLRTDEFPTNAGISTYDGPIAGRKPGTGRNFAFRLLQPTLQCKNGAPIGSAVSVLTR